MCLYTWNTSIYICIHEIFPDGSVVKNLSASAGDTGDVGLIPGLERSPGGGNGNPRQDSCLENPMDREAWWATVHWVAKSQTRLSENTPCWQEESSTRAWRPYEGVCSFPSKEMRNDSSWISSGGMTWLMFYRGPSDSSAERQPPRKRREKTLTVRNVFQLRR